MIACELQRIEREIPKVAHAEEAWGQLRFHGSQAESDAEFLGNFWAEVRAPGSLPK